MKISRFDLAMGKPIDKFGSTHFSVTSIVHLTSEAHVSCAYLDAGGQIGLHPATASQLFLVVQGEGTVQSGSENPIPTSSG